MSDHCDSVPTVVEETVVAPADAPAEEAAPVVEVVEVTPAVEEAAPAPAVEEAAPAPAVEEAAAAPSY